jgi:hypothetical protein
MRFYTIVFSLFVFLTQILVSAESDDHHHDHMKPQHGGKILEVGKHIAFIELVHDENNGKITLYIFDKNGKSMPIDDSPRLNIIYKIGKTEKKKQLITKGLHKKHNKAYEFESVNEILKGDDFELIVSLKINKKSYRVTLDHSHHEAGEHDSHDHDDHKGHKH